MSSARRPDGGAPARRAVFRWAWRLFKREWRQQALVLALLAIAVAATVVGTASATNTSGESSATFTVPGSDPHLDSDIAALRQRFGDRAVVASHRTTPIPGSTATLDLRSQDPAAAGPTLRLLTGRFPATASEAALTRPVATLFDVPVGGAWDDGTGTVRTVVGLVENAKQLDDRFALVTADGLGTPESVSVRIEHASRSDVEFRLPSGTPTSIAARSETAKTAAAVAVLALATIGLLFVGLVAVAGFTVMAQRHLRALGMLSSIGATDRHVRLALIANGLVVGAAGAVTGTVAGIAVWLLVAPGLEGAANRRIDRFALSWWTLAASVALAVAAAVAAAWWPARAASRIPTVAALAGRPPRRRGGSRPAALGVVLLAGGAALLAFAHERKALFIVGGMVGVTVGLLLLAPLGLGAVAAVLRRSPVAVRVAVRDLSRYRSRSGAALGAITLAVGIAATIAVSAGVSRAGLDDGTGGNLGPDQLVLRTGGSGFELVPDVTPAQQAANQERAFAAAAAAGVAGTDVIPLQVLVDPNGPNIAGVDGRPGGRPSEGLVDIRPQGDGGQSISLEAVVFLGTPELLQRYGIDPASVDPSVDVLTSRASVAGLQLATGPRSSFTPKVQHVALPRFSSGPNTLLTTAAAQRLGLETRTTTWLVQAKAPLTAKQTAAVRKVAAAAGLVIETRDTGDDLVRLGRYATLAGAALALAVLAMTVGLIRSETAGDLRTLAAAGAASWTRRTITATTAGVLAVLGAVLGTAGAYAALVAFHRSDLTPMRHLPLADLAVILLGLPAIAIAGGWLLAGREPPTLVRPRLD